MKTIYLAIQCKLDGEKKYKDVEIEVTDEQYQGLLDNAEDNVVSNNVVNMFFSEWSSFLDKHLKEFAEELGLKTYSDLPLSVDIRLDKPWPEALKEYLAELDRGIADGDTMALLHKGYYYKHKVEDTKKAMECYLKAMYQGDENAFGYLLEDNLDGVEEETKRTVLSFIVSKANENNLNALIALGCIDFDFDNLIDKEIANIIKYSDLGFRFLLQFISESGSLNTIRGYFEHGIFIEKDEHMVEIIDSANERLFKKREDFEQKEYDFYSGDDSEPINYDEAPQRPIELTHGAAEILMGSGDDTNYFINWVVQQCQQKGARRYIASTILIFLDDLDLCYCNAGSVHRIADELKNF